VKIICPSVVPKYYLLALVSVLILITRLRTSSILMISKLQNGFQQPLFNYRSVNMKLVRSVRTKVRSVKTKVRSVKTAVRLVTIISNQMVFFGFLLKFSFTVSKSHLSKLSVKSLIKAGRHCKVSKYSK